MLETEIQLFLGIMFIILFAVLVLLHFTFQNRLVPIMQPFMSLGLGLTAGLFVCIIFGFSSFDRVFTMILFGIGVSFFASWFANKVIKAPTL